MENELISVNHDMFKEETIKRFNYGYGDELMNYMHRVGEYLPRYADSEYTFVTVFHTYCCMDEYDAIFDVFSKSSASKDQIFIQLHYSRVKGLSPAMNKIDKEAFILRINDTNITLQRSNVDKERDSRGGVDVTILYEISKEMLKQIADARQLYVRIPLMKDLQQVEKEVFEGADTEEDKRRYEKEWQDVQKEYARECKNFQLMCRLFYAAAIDETAYPGLIEKEIEVLKETKKIQEKRRDEYIEEKQQEEIKEKKKKNMGELMENLALSGYPSALIVGGIWGFMISSWAPLIWLLVLVTVILIIMAIIRKN